MNFKVLVAVAMLVSAACGQTPVVDQCKNPTVVQRRMADDVRYASPFYVIALPRTAKTEQIDNVCYSYFEAGNNTFTHFISIVYKNGTNSHKRISKGDITDRSGLAEGRAKGESPCTYHDFTLTPICNVSVFILYRCFLEGDCKEADIGRTENVDVRVVLAASTSISEACRQETELSLRDTSSLNGGDYVILPQQRNPRCVIGYGDKQSLNSQRAHAQDSITVPEEVSSLDNRLGDDSFMLSGSSLQTPLTSSGSQDKLFLTQKTPQTTIPKNTYAEVVKSSKYFPKIMLTPWMNFFPYTGEKIC